MPRIQLPVGGQTGWMGEDQLWLILLAVALVALGVTYEKWRARHMSPEAAARSRRSAQRLIQGYSRVQVWREGSD